MGSIAAPPIEERRQPRAEARSRIVLRLEKFMIKHDLTNAKTAHFLSVDESQVSRWLNGDRFPSLHSRRAITRLLKKKTPAKVWRD